MNMIQKKIVVLDNAQSMCATYPLVHEDMNDEDVEAFMESMGHNPNDCTYMYGGINFVHGNIE